MKLLLFLSCLIATTASVIKDKPCEDEVIHIKDTLRNDLDRPYFLNTDYTSNTVYFSYSYSLGTLFKSGKIDLNSEEFTEIEGVTNGFAQCVDAKTGDVYIGGSDGVYKYNKTSNKAELYGAKGKNIWMVFFKDVLYYSEYLDSEDVYMIVDGKVLTVKELEGTAVEFLIIDRDDNMFYANDTGLYRQKKGDTQVVYYEGTSSMSIRGITTDLNDDVYVVAEDGIYAVNKTTNDLNLHLEISYAYGLTFDDKNNIVYSDEFSINKLNTTTYSDCI